MRTPLLVVTGVEPIALDSTMVSLGWDLPGAVLVRHRIDPYAQVLTRTVSDATGLLETEHVQLEHACTSCALREDVVPTLDRLATDGRWQTIVSALPTGTGAEQLTHVIARDTRLARRLRIASVIAALSAGDVPRDLLGDALLRERDVHTGPDDDRGVGEVACAQVERADVVVVDHDPGPGRESVRDLLTALARHDAEVLIGVEQLDAPRLAAAKHSPLASRAWADPPLEAPPATLVGGRAWRLDLCSPRAFHHERLLEDIERLGGGPFRSRGCFWVPTRPGDMLEWAGSGGQLSIGAWRPWGRRTPQTRLLVTGLGSPPAQLREAFADLLLTPGESALPASYWHVVEDGLEPWLGDIRDAA
ncbi:cobalamin biosynthesis protein CobW [Nocardioidaceae bacterium]|nr:cobalamin biosynthesis protein CobW [Nocardioidaceae bacterium]